MHSERNFNPWDKQPRILTETEIASPMLVVHEVFDYAHLPDLRNGLWEWLKTTISGNFNKGSLHYKDRESLLALYERMQKLLEAAHLLMVAHNLTLLKLSAQKEDVSFSTFGGPVIAPTTELQPIVDRLLNLLIPDFVFNLGKVEEEENAPVYHFIVVLPGSAGRSYAEYQALVENACTESGSVQLLTVKTAELQKHLQEGHLLFSRVCTTPYLLYQKADTHLPKPDYSNLPGIAKAAEETFDLILQKAQEFYEGAIFYLGKNNYSVSVFMLQQAVEHTLRGFLQALLHRNYITHDLTILRRLALPLYPELMKLLPVSWNRNECLLYRLGKAYTQARYQPDYRMPVMEISEVKGWVEKLLIHTKPALMRHIHALPIS